ncbi:hypothetical protein ACFL6U_06015 [Planctomycetota bacterium]
MVLASFFVFLFAHSQIVAYDTMWHLRTGDLILSGVFPQTDIFSYTAYGREWILHEWGSEVIFSLCYKWSGWNGLVVFRALIFSITMGIMFRLLQKRNINLFLAILLTFSCYFATLITWTVRPHIFSILFLTLLLYLYDAYIHRNSKAIYILPLLFMLWINLHGGYVIGFIFLATALSGEGLSLALGVNNDRDVSWRKLAILSLIAGVSFLCCFINPLGAKLVFYPLMYLGDTMGDFYTFITEWQASSSRNALSFIALVIATCIAALGSRKKLPLYEVLVVFVFMFFGFKAIRHTAIFAIVAIPAVSSLIEDILSRSARILTDRTRDALSKSLKLIRYYLFSRSITFLKKEDQVFNPILLALILLLLLLVSTTILSPLVNARLSSKQYPKETLSYLKESPHLEGNIFNQYAWGGIIIKELPNKKVFIDGRADVYQKDIIEQYKNVIVLKEDWSEILKKHNVTHILVDPNQIIARFLPGIDPNWHIAEEDDNSVLLLHNKVHLDTQ